MTMPNLMPLRLAIPLLALLIPAAFANQNSAALREISDQYVDWQRPGNSASQARDLSARGYTGRIAEKKRMLDALLAVGEQGLSAEEDIDRRLLIGILRADVNTGQTLRRWENDPSLYLPGSGLDRLLESAASGDAESRDQLLAMLATLPKNFDHGRASLKRPPERFTRAAIFQAENRLKALDEGMENLAGLSAEQLAAAQSARAAFAAYLAFLEEDLLPRSDGSWALGRPAYDFILQQRWHMDSDADRIHRRGLKAFEDTERLAQETAERIQPGKHWTEVYETIKLQHPSADGLKQAYQEQMDLARVFVKQHGVLTLPDGERVITLDTPPAMRRSSPFGTFEMVSPFDDGLEGRLMLTPIESWMSPEQQEQRLQSHHSAWIPVIAVHEAYPGHHAHGIKMKENPNMLRRVVHEPIFTEGWGLFTEELMYELGFLKGDEVRLTQLRNRLWRAARVILDSGLHTGRMSFEEAVQFLVERVRFEPYAAELEVGMYIREPTYVLGYLIGMEEILAIRAEYTEKYGEPDPPSQFYDRLLSVGSIPPALVREELFAPAAE
jgi:uncharacterized protein (DUF885 family)